jgi:hypothetical protein
LVHTVRCTRLHLPQLLVNGINDSATLATSHPVAKALRQPRRAPRLLVIRPHGFYLNTAVRRDYSSPGRTGSTSALPCAASTRLPATTALHQLRRASRLLVTRTHRLYVNLAVRREYSSPGRSDSTSTTPYTATTSSSGRTTTSTSLNQKTSRGRLPRHQQLVGSTFD